ncbi:MAG: reverse transcriptase family protein [Promethearchaeota archaeon]
MIDISHILEKDEEIVWQHIGKKKDIIEGKLSKFKLPLYIFAMIFGIICFLFSILSILALIAFVVIFLMSLSRDTDTRRERITFLTSTLKLTYQELRRFREYYILTNKRWIQREAKIELYKYSYKFPKKIDIGKFGISIDLTHIKIWILSNSMTFHVENEEYKKRIKSNFGIPFREKNLERIISEKFNFIYGKIDEGNDLFYQEGVDIKPYEISQNLNRHDIKYLGSNLKKYKKELKQRMTLIGYLKKFNLPVLENPDDLASFLNIDYYTLKKFCIIEEVQSPYEFQYRRFSIKKKSGGKRTILAPKKELRTIQDKINENILKKIEPSEFAHGFRANHSIVSHAKVHLNAEIIYNLDIKNFFPSIKYYQVLNVFKNLGYSGLISSLLASLCTIPYRFYTQLNTWKLMRVENNLPQGAPTSPSLSNLVCLALDRELNWISEKYRYRYTRYVDDLTFSSISAINIDNEFIYKIFNCLQKHGFKINKKKMNVSAQNIKARNFKYRRVTGIIVHKDYLSLPRFWIRRLRAALYELRHINIDKDDPYLKKLIKNIEGRCSYAIMVNKDRYIHFLEELNQLGNRKFEFKETIKDGIKFCPMCGTRIKKLDNSICKKCGKNVND